MDAFLNTNHQCLLLGKNYTSYGEVEYCFIDNRVTCAISVGADRGSPSLEFKGKSTETNEDAVLAIQRGHRLLLAVADAHFGIWASDSIISGLARCAHRIDNIESLHTALQKLCNESYDLSQHSETTLLIILVDLSNGDGFGISYGDSSALLVNKTGVRRINHKNNTYINLNTGIRTDIHNQFIFKLMPEECLVLFTDGVDECHYGNPATSVNEEHIFELFLNSKNDTKLFVSQLASLALVGVDGNPGGQDNIAIAAVIL